MAAVFLVDGVIVALAVAVNRGLALVPRPLQNAVEAVVEYFRSFAEPICGDRTDKIFPWFLSFFVFILVSNLMGLLPGFGTIRIGTHGDSLPMLRTATSDLNMTLALALVSAGATHLMSIRTIGWGHYLGRFFSLNPLFLFIGLIEIISEFSKLVSLSFRLFGNIFAGEVLLDTLGGLSPFTAFLVPVPALFFELMVAVIQAFVFAMLTMAFMSIMTEKHAA